MTITEFCTKYAITGEEAAGLSEASRYWAAQNFAEKLLIQIYVRTFGTYPGGIEPDPELGGGTSGVSEINDSLVSPILTWSSEKINGILDYTKFEQSFFSGLQG
jgi:hypothetical protein